MADYASDYTGMRSSERITTESTKLHDPHRKNVLAVSRQHRCDAGNLQFASIRSNAHAPDVSAGTSFVGLAATESETDCGLSGSPYLLCDAQMIAAQDGAKISVRVTESA